MSDANGGTDLPEPVVEPASTPDTTPQVKVDDSLVKGVEQVKDLVKEQVAPQVVTVFQRPDVKAALVIGPVLLAIGLFDVMTGFIGTLVSSFVRAIIYATQGYLVAKFVARSDAFDESRLVRLAMVSAVMAWLISAIWALLCLGALGAMSGGLAFALIPIFLGSHLVSIIVNVVVTPVAAKLAYRHGGAQMAARLGCVALAGMGVTALLGAGVIGFLVWLGIELFS